MQIFHRAKNIKTKLNIKTLVIGILIALVLILGVFVGVIYWGFYILEWRGQFINEISQVLPLPAATVNDSVVLNKDYLSTLKISRKYYETQTAKGIKGLPEDSQVQKNVIDRLIEDQIVLSLARKYDVSVTRQEVTDKMEEIIKNKGSREETESFLQEFYGIDIASYGYHFIEPNLWYEKVNNAIIASEEVNGAARKKIEDAYNELKQGADFGEVVKKYSEGENAGTGGAVGNFLRGELPKDIEAMLFSLNEGEYTEILTIRNSTEVIRLDKKDEDKGVLTLSAVVVKIKTIEEVVKEEKEKAQIKIYALSD